MTGFQVFVIKDDYDQKTVCVIDGAPSEHDAIEYAKNLYPDDIKGDLYGYQVDLVEYSED